MISSSLLLAPPWPSSRVHFDHFTLASPRKRFHSRLKIQACWIPNAISKDDFGGWYSSYKPEIDDKKVLNQCILVGFGTSVMIILAGLTYHSFHNKVSGFKYTIPAPVISFYEKFTKKPNKDIETQKAEDEKNLNSKHDESSESKENLFQVQWEKYKIGINVPVDTAQENALSILKRLQIIENDTNGDELCTRREFARWFVKLNSNLERNKMHKIIPNLLVSELVISAFNDIKIDDPDFYSIQLLAETGLIPSKLSSLSDFNFFPESYLSRFDLLNIKALIEHPFTTEINKKIINKKASFLDLRACPNLSPPLFIDLISGEKSIFNRVFGNSRLIQPYKPVTKAQVAVCLTSGRNEKLIQEELIKLDQENNLKLALMEEIKQGLIQKGEIEKFWRTKLEKERERESEQKMFFEGVKIELEREREEREREERENVKEKLALEGERQFLLGLKREIEELSEKVNSEKKEVLSEKVSVRKDYLDVYGKYESVIDTKSRLESEKEALIVLRSWIEDEARRIQSRADLLEQALRRWRVNTNGD